MESLTCYTAITAGPQHLTCPSCSPKQSLAGARRLDESAGCAGGQCSSPGARAMMPLAWHGHVGQAVREPGQRVHEVKVPAKQVHQHAVADCRGDDRRAPLDRGQRAEHCVTRARPPSTPRCPGTAIAPQTPAPPTRAARRMPRTLNPKTLQFTLIAERALTSCQWAACFAKDRHLPVPPAHRTAQQALPGTA